MTLTPDIAAADVVAGHRWLTDHTWRRPKWTISELEAAKAGRTVSVVLPALNEEDTVGSVVETITPLLGRGILLDVAAHRGAGPEGLPPGYAITADDLESAAEAAGVHVADGDTVFVRTGWAATRYAEPDRYIGWETGVPGPDLSAARWLSTRGVVATGTDTAAYEVLAPGAGHARLPVHGHLLAEAGVHLIEQTALDELAACGGHVFALVAVPLCIVGATGSPLRPLALLPTQPQDA